MLLLPQLLLLDSEFSFQARQFSVPEFGYAIEVTKANLAAVPADYIRKQTMVNAERFTTEELRTKEREVLRADEQALARETAAEVRRVALVVVWTFVAFVFGTLAMLLLAVTVIIAFWEEHRLMAATAVTTVFLLVAAAAVFQVRKKLAQRNRIIGG